MQVSTALRLYSDVSVFVFSIVALALVQFDYAFTKLVRGVELTF
jgi:hypothetical protein